MVTLECGIDTMTP